MSAVWCIYQFSCLGPFYLCKFLKLHSTAESDGEGRVTFNAIEGAKVVLEAKGEVLEKLVSIEIILYLP